MTSYVLGWMSAYMITFGTANVITVVNLTVGSIWKDWSFV